MPYPRPERRGVPGGSAYQK